MQKAFAFSILDVKLASFTDGRLSIDLIIAKEIIKPKRLIYLHDACLRHFVPQHASNKMVKIDVNVRIQNFE